MFSFNSAIRKRAREVLGNKIFDSGWLYGVVVVLIVGAIAYFASAIYLLLAGIVSVGVSAYFIARVRGEASHDQLNVATDGAQKNLGGACVTGILQSIFVALWTILFVIPGIVKSLSYSMAFYIRNDHPEYTATQAIDESRRLMNGHKWQLFTLYCSFIGWIIVGALCFGVGVVWVLAYMETARAVFYQELVMEEESRANEPEAYDEATDADKSV